MSFSRFGDFLSRWSWRTKQSIYHSQPSVFVVCIHLPFCVVHFWNETFSWKWTFGQVVSFAACESDPQVYSTCVTPMKDARWCRPLDLKKGNQAISILMLNFVGEWQLQEKWVQHHQVELWRKRFRPSRFSGWFSVLVSIWTHLVLHMKTWWHLYVYSLI